MRKLSFLFFLILILLTATFFRLWQIAQAPPGLYPDEAMNGNNALEAIENTDFSAQGGPAFGWKVFYSENNGREGLFINIQAISLKIFGNKPWALRLPSAVFGILTVLGLFLLAKELFGGRTALMASFFLATSFWHINFSRIGFRAIMAPAFLVWGLYFLFFSLDKISSIENGALQKIKNQNAKIKITIQNSKLKILIFSVVGGILYGLGFYSYIAYRVTPAIILILMFGFWFLNRKTIDNKKFLLLVTGFWLLVIITISPLAFYFYNNPGDFLGRTSQISIFSSENPLAELGKNILKTAGMFWWSGDYNWRHNYSGSPQLWWPVGILFGLGILISIIRIFRNPNVKIRMSNKIQNPNDQNNRKLNTGIWKFIGNWTLEIRNLKRTEIFPEMLLLSWLITGLLPVIISSEGLPHALRAIIVLPPVMLISAIGLEWFILKINGWLAVQKNKYPEYSRRLDRIKKELIIFLFIFFIAVAVNSFNQYFFRWLSRPEVENAFNKNYVEIGNYLNSLPKDLPKYVIVNADGVDARGIPMPAQTVMFITKTFLPKWQDNKNIHYLVPNFGTLISEIENGCAKNCVITMLENDSRLRGELKEKIPELEIDASPGFAVLRK